MGIMGFIAFLSTTFICLLYKVDVSVGMPCLLLSSGNHLNLLGLGQQFCSGQKNLNSTHVPVPHWSTSVLRSESKGLIFNPSVCYDRAPPFINKKEGV